MKKEDNWIKKNYSRILIDNHISECDEALLSKYSPENYVSMIQSARLSAAMVYACDHNGNCYYPTRAGHMHKNLNGRDVFGEVISNLKKTGITPIAYTTVVYHNHSAKNHPGWRMEDANGNQHDGRYWYSCISNESYVAFAEEQLREVLGYDVAGIFIDMTFWPFVCTCSNCRERYRRETGRNIPETVDWSNPEWVEFQRARERWMVEFSARLADLVRREFPGKTVTVQNSPILHGWTLAQTRGISAASDYTSGDFYGGKFQHRFGAKVMSAHSNEIPFEFMTSRCIYLFDHTTTKSEDELTVSALTTLAHGGAYLMIDAINPDGSLEPRIYKLFGELTRTLAPYERLIQRENPVLAADVGIYFSMSSFVNPGVNGKSLRTVSDRCTHMDGLSKIPTITEMIGTSRFLNRLHIPHTVVPEDLQDISGFKTIFINNAAYLSPAECERLRTFVRNGGTLIATGATSLYDLAGKTTGDFALSDLFGASYTGKMSDKVNYLHDNVTGEKHVATAPCPLVEATTAKSIAKIATPWFQSFDPERYVSIHSNPWGEVTEFDAVTIHSFGKGSCIYIAQELLSYEFHDHQSYLRALLRKHIATAYRVETNAPACVEITVLKSTQSDRWIIALINYQDELPNIPLHDLKISITLPGIEIKEVRLCTGAPVKTQIDGNKVSISLPVLGNAEFFEVLI
jgi:hypothetical protein